MTKEEIRVMLVSVDPDIRHYWSMQEDRPYTYWEETRRLPFTADDRHEEAWKFYVHRFAVDERDQIADRLYEVLDADPRVTVIYTVDPEREHGMIHHIYECEGY